MCVWRRWSLVAAGLCVVCAATVGSQDADHWIDVMRDGTSEARRAGREALIAMGPAAMPALIVATYDEADFIRWEAVNALGVLAALDSVVLAEAIPAIAERSLTDPDSHTRWRSLWALSSYEADQTEDLIVPILREGLDANEDQHRWYAAVAMAYFQQPEAVPHLHAGLDREAYFDRWEAVYCLGLVHDDDSVGLLCDVFRDVEGREEGLRQEAAMTLARIGDPGAVPALTDALDDPAGGVRWRAAAALEGIVGVDALDVIEAALVRETDALATEMLTAIVERLSRRLAD